MLHSARFNQLWIARMHQHHNASGSVNDCIMHEDAFTPCGICFSCSSWRGGWNVECGSNYVHSLESLFSSTSRPIFISHMAVVRSNFYTLEGNHVDLVASLKIFRGCFKVEAFYWPSTPCNLGLLGHITCCCNGETLIIDIWPPVCVSFWGQTHTKHTPTFVSGRDVPVAQVTGTP